jgi:hypothetical protein
MHAGCTVFNIMQVAHAALCCQLVSKVGEYTGKGKPGVTRSNSSGHTATTPERSTGS